MSSSNDAITHGGKTSWPEAVGKPIEQARLIILSDMPDAHIVVINAGVKVTGDDTKVTEDAFRGNRVLVFVKTVIKNSNPKVEETTILEDKPVTEFVGTPVTEDYNPTRVVEIVVPPAPHVV